MPERILITGPESTGKSSLSEQLAEHYNCQWVPEFAREYISRLQRPYELRDIEFIAMEQIRMENEMVKRARRLVICDTGLLVPKVWAEYKFGSCPQWIIESFVNHQYDLILLMDIDLPWKEDPQREHPDKRAYFFSRFRDELHKAGKSYSVVSGRGEERFQNALHIISNYLRSV